MNANASWGTAGRPIDVLLVGVAVGRGDSLAERLERTADDLRVHVESDPGAVPRRVREEDIECVVAGHDFPGGDGLSLLDAVGETPSDPAFVLVAPGADPDALAAALAAGVDDCVRRVDRDEDVALLASRVETLVAADRARRSYREVFEKATVGLTVHDADGKFLDANRHYADMLGYDYDELADLTLADVSAGEEPYTAERARELLERTAADGGPRRFEWLDETRDGDRIWVEVCLRTAEVGGHERILGSVRDVTDRKRRQEELEATNERLREQAERLEEFASVVSHDLRNPIEVARAQVGLARETGEVDRLERAEAAIDRMEAIVDGVLTLARQGDVVDDPAPVPVAAVARDAWGTVATGAATLHVEDGLGAVKADRDSLRDLLENCVRNAVDHAGEAPTVRVGPLPADDGGSDGTVGFYVADDGPGIDPADREAVFERGYSTRADGTGLGLAIVETVAEAHGWTVRMAESREGGARVEVRGIDPVGDGWVE